MTTASPRRRILVPALAILIAACSDGEEPFTPIPPIEGAITALVGDPLTNSVYVDLETGTTTPVPAASWDLAFESAGSHVLVNTGKKARVLDTGSTDFESVTSTVADDYGTSYVFETLDGDLAAAAMGEDPRGTVYILDLGTDEAGAPLGHRKILIEDDSPGASVRIRYAEPDGSAEQTRTIALSDSHDFTYFSLDTGTTVDVEPESGQWDLVVTPVAVRTGPPFAPVYRLTVSVQTNRYAGVSVAVDDPASGLERSDDPAAEINQLGIAASRYDQLGLVDFAAIGAHDAADAIGRGWLQILQPHSAGVFKVYDFITYLVKTPEGNHFKLRFLSYVDPGTGKNGTVQFEYRELD